MPGASAILAITLLAVTGSGDEGLPGLVRVVSKNAGCKLEGPYVVEASGEFQLEGKVYVGPHEVPSETARKLLELLGELERTEADEPTPVLDRAAWEEHLARAGLKPDLLRGRGAELYARAREYDRARSFRAPLHPLPRELPPELTYRFEPEWLLRSLADLSYDPSFGFGRKYRFGSTSWVSYALELGTDVPWTVSFWASDGASYVLRQGMLPIRIRHGERSWKSWDPDLPDLVREFAPADRWSKKLLGFRSYWSGEVLEDGKVWWRLFRDAVEFENAAWAFREVAGYHDALERFHFECARRWFPGKGQKVDFALRPRFGTPVRELRWSVRMERGDIRRDWHELVATFEQVERTIQSCDWLTEWLTGAPRRAVDVELEDLSGALTNEDRAVWSDCKFDEQPAWRLELRDPERLADLILSESGTAALVLGARNVSAPGEAQWFQAVTDRLPPGWSRFPVARGPEGEVRKINDR